MNKTIISLIILLCSLRAFAGVVDHNVMYQAYLDNNMAKWGSELRKYTSQPNLSVEDKMEISNYLYGYIASLLANVSENRQELNQWIDLWDDYLDEIEKAIGKRADIYVYRSSNNAYKAKVKSGGMMVYGPRSLSDLNRALNLDANNALANGLKGNTKFYMPTFVGGDKKEAIKWFEKALNLMANNTSVVYRWNRCAITLCLAQAYEKTGNKQKAIEICTAELQREPNFAYMRDVYLPSLKKSL